ncbi:hypothetical protein [Bradyrhizobium sp. NP1]|uniref:hypothetical protein n=1 Tax=Bradyrhizobium sp. NP1 TaxID=3049772 RepID=UPI0025A56804|nr:hypothetical protein [Bradyrhizobium sp. NP1]WJR81669.1 hypothetical protein QOU61_07640 [Bradyrhizobium sp. NP1]
MIVASGLPALAQSAEEEDGAEAPAAEAEASPSQDVDMSGIDVDKLDWSQLNVDASTLAYSGPKGGAPRRADGGDATWSAKDRVGGTAVSVKQSISPFWDTRIGADMTVVRAPATMSELLAEKTANGGNLPQSAGSAWAAVTAPGAGPLWDKTAVEARLDPSQEQSRFGTSLSKSLPLDEQYSLTLQNGYNLIQQGLVPLPGIAPHPSRNYQTDQSARLSIGNTGTSIIAGQALSSADDRWLRRIGAEQQLFDGVSVSGTIGETPQGATSKSLTAGFKRTW